MFRAEELIHEQTKDWRTKDHKKTSLDYTSISFTCGIM